MATCTYSSTGPGDDLANVATVAAPGGITDLDDTNNEATDFVVFAGNLIFMDGFESGDLGAWSSSIP